MKAPRRFSVAVGLLVVSGAGLAACLLQAGCSRGDEVRAAEPLAEADPEPPRTESDLVQPPRAGARAEESLPEPVPAGPVRPQSLAQVIAALDDASAPRVLVQASEVELLFSKPDDTASAEPYADHRYLDLIGDGQDELVVAISGGWWGTFLHVCVFTRDAEGAWRLALRGKAGSCRGLPTLRLAGEGERRGLVVGVHDSWGSGCGSSSWIVLAPQGERLENVLQVPSDGWLAGWGTPLDLEYRTVRFEVGEGAHAASAELVLRVDGTGPPLLEGQVDVQLELVQRYEQARPGARFTLVEGASSVDREALLALVESDWLTRNETLAFERARNGTALQKRWLLKLAQSLEQAGGHPRAPLLRNQLPTVEALDAQIAAEASESP